MKFDSFERIVVCIIANIPLSLFMYNYLDIPTKYLSIILFITTMFFMLLTYVFCQKIRIILKLSLPSKVLLPVIYASCLIIVSLLPSISERVFVYWPSVGIFSWIRVLAGLLLGAFLPGFTILSLFEHKLPPFLLLPVSFLLSVFINALIAFVTLMFGQPFLPWILTANTLVIILSIIKIVHNRICHLIEYKSIILDNEDILMFLLSLFQFSLVTSVFFLSGLTVPNGDMWDHASMATRIEKGELTRFGVLTYPPFFSLHLFSVSQLSGLPPINISDILGLFNIIIILAFYDLAFMLTNNKSTAFLSTFIFTTFGSFTFLVQAVLGKMPADVQSLSQYFLQISKKTTTINSIYTISNIYAYAPSVLHLLSVLVLTSFIVRKDKTYISYIVEAILVLNLFLLHIAETVYVLIFLFSALILGLSNIRDLLSLTLGVCLGVIIISSLHFVQVDISIYIGILYAVTLIFTVLYGKFLVHEKISALLKELIGMISSSLVKTILASAMLSFYGILLLIWKVLYIDKDWYITSLLGYLLGAFPTYFMPIAFGLPLLISILYLSKCFFSRRSLSQDEKKILAFLGIAFAIAYIFGKVVTLLGLSGYMIYRELRILSTFGGIVFPIVSGLALHKICEFSKYLKINQKGIVVIGLGLLVLLNSGSTFLSATFWSNIGMDAYPINPSELQALEFLKQKVKPSNVVLTYRSARSTKVGLTGATTLFRYSVPFSSLSPSIPKVYLQVVDYIYLTKQDYDMIQKSDTYMKSVLNTLPIIFNNTEVLIFEVPQSVKRYNEGTSVSIVINTDLKEVSPKIAFLDSLGLSYSIYDEWDFRYFTNSKTVILLDDVKNASEAEKYIDWVKEGGQLIILGNGGYFLQSMKNHAKEKDSFIFEKEIGEGKILYVNFASFLKSRLMEYSKEAFLRSLDPSLLNYVKQNAGVRLVPIEIYGEQGLNGNINISSMDVAFYGSNITSQFKLANGEEFSINADRLIFYYPHNLTLSLNTSAIIRPLHDEYVEILIPKGTVIRLSSYYKDGEVLAYLSDGSKLYNVSEVIFNPSSNVSLIVRSPSIAVSGIVTFQGAFFDIPYNKIIGSGQGNITLRGKIAYNILISDKAADRCYGNHFYLAGSYKYDYPTLLEIELPIDIANALEQNLLSFLAVLMLLCFVAIILKNKNKNRKSESDCRKGGT